jgi:hypothetical protein
MRTTGDAVIPRSTTALAKIDRAKLTTSLSVEGSMMVLGRSPSSGRAFLLAHQSMRVSKVPTE